jgi:two-component system, LytTR family, response regulator
MTGTVTALIVDDEPLARKKIRDLLAGVPWIECVGEVGDGLTAVSAIDEQQPDLVFLDIHMPRLSGLDILHRAKHAPAVIFTTAYDRYAVTAFELAAVDYLLKPFGRERLLSSLERVRALLGRGDTGQSAVRSREAFAAGPARRLFVREAGRVIPVRTTDIVRLEASDDFVYVHTTTERYRMGVPLQQIAERLEPSQFVRVHRSHIVNMDHVASLSPYDGSRIQVRLRNGTVIVASRQCSRVLRELGAS